jgi:protein gp37
MPTGITYCDKTWNPVVGCRPVSEGCANCFAAAFASRELCDMHKGLTDGPRWRGDRINYSEAALARPLRWTKPRIVLAPSMGDFFFDPGAESDDRVCPDNRLLYNYFRVMELADKHTFLVLTKRAVRAFEFLIERDPIPNVVIGFTVENQRRADERLPLLAELAALGWRTWVSFEPLLGWVNCIGNMIRGFEFAAVGGEAGPGSRPCSINWIRSVMVQCRKLGSRVHFKQLGSNSDWPRGWKLKSRKGGNLDEIPHDLRVREMVRTVSDG